MTGHFCIWAENASSTGGGSHVSKLPFKGPNGHSGKQIVSFDIADERGMFVGTMFSLACCFSS